MQSRAYLLLEREHIQLQEAGLFGITVSPVREDLLEWVATVQGLKDSLWEVDTITGKPCIDFLDNPRKWEEGFSLTTILLTVQVMLSNPVLENAVNVEAIEMLRENPSRYREMVLECVRTSRQIKETGIMLAVKSFSMVHFQDQICALPQGKPLRIKRIAFDDYHKAWSEIATSKATPSCKDQMLVPYPNLQVLCNELGKEELQKEIEAQNKAFSDVMYGTFGKGRKTRVTMDQKLARIEHMKQNYIMDRSLEASTSASLNLPSNIKTKRPNTSIQEEEPWDKEVDSLVNWTTGLNLDELEDD
ncbi:ubiquitin-conjugating enzyme E2 U-like isoform X2 [Heterodontus francisci]|uniref:ubiquitin-conjugating enzyme E2 U-like isoform X2 n=1 Tax=Heterodontus francisci TaxID=7792 RepID=UPI00355C7561